MSAVQELTEEREKAHVIYVEKREAHTRAKRALLEAERAVAAAETDEKNASAAHAKLAHAVRVTRVALGMREEEDD